MFKTDYSEVADGNVLLPEGDYEVIFRHVGEGITQNNVTRINISMVVRNDVDQKFKDKLVWDSLYQVRQPSEADLSCGGYSYKRIQSLSKGAGLPNEKEYGNLDEWCNDFENRCSRIVIKHELYEGKTRAKVKYYNETRFPVCKHVWKSPDEEEEYITDEAPATPPPAPKITTLPPDAPKATTAKPKPVVNDDDVPFND